MGHEFQPYVGPRPFEQKDKDFFFGRDKEARDLLSLVIAYNEVLVYAPSGAGKTSLLNAKLIPMLEDNGFEVLPIARVRGTATEEIKAEEIPNIYVFNTLWNWAGIKEPGQLKNMSLVDFLKRRKSKTDEDGFRLKYVIIFDQFEEIFSWYQGRWKDRKGFFEQISEAMKDPLLHIVFVMREDYNGQLDPYAPLLPDKLRIRFHIERMRRDSALLAITAPLRTTGYSYANGVAEKLVDDLLKIIVETEIGKFTEVIGEFVEALQLQVVSMRLWELLPETNMQITMDYVDKYGNVNRALSSFYDEAIKIAVRQTRLVDERKLRKWFEEVLITSMGTRGMAYMGPKTTGGIPNPIIAILENNHILRAEWRAGARWYELIHDRFIEPILASNKLFEARTMGLEENERENRRGNQAVTKAEKEWGEKNYIGAFKLYEEAIVIFENIGDSWGLANAYFNIGMIHDEMKNYALAIEKFQKALEIDPNSASAWYNKARVLSRINGDSEVILKCLSKAIELDNTYLKAAEKDSDFENVRSKKWFGNLISGNR